MASKLRTPTGRRRGNLIPGGPVAPNYKLMSASEAIEARKEYHSLRKNYRDGIRCERLRVNKGSSFDEVDYTGRPEKSIIVCARITVTVFAVRG